MDVQRCGDEPPHFVHDRIEALDVPDADGEAVGDLSDKTLPLLGRKADRLLDEGVDAGPDALPCGRKMVRRRDADRDRLGLPEELLHRSADLGPVLGGDGLCGRMVEVVDVGRPDLLQLGVDPDVVAPHRPGADDARVHQATSLIASAIYARSSSVTPGWTGIEKTVAARRSATGQQAGRPA